MAPGRGLRVGWTGAACALFAGLLLRTFFVLHHPRFAGDTLVYGDLAGNLLQHSVYGLTEERIRPTLIRLPGYPLFLALCFAVFGVGNYVPVLWIQVAVDLCGCVLLADLARRIFAQRAGQRAGLAALWLGALCPFTANYTAAALTETLSIFCVTAALWALFGWQEKVRSGESSLLYAGAIGCALTSAALLRPDGGLLAAAVVPSMMWVALGKRGSSLRRGAREVGVASACVCVALGMWAVRNWRVFHVAQPLAPKYANDPGEDAPLGFARWYRTWGVGFGDTVQVYWPWDGSVERMEDLPRRAFDSPAQRAETAALYGRYNRDTTTTPALDAAFARLAAERVQAYPLRYYVVLPSARLADMWLRPRTELMKLPLDWLRVRVHPRRSAFEIVYAGLNGLLLLLAITGWRRWRWSRWSDAGAVAFAATAYVALRSAMLMTIDNSEPRYTLECFPVVLLCASASFVVGRRLSGGSI